MHNIGESCYIGHCECNQGKDNEGNTLNRIGCRALACTWRPQRPSCRSGGTRDPKYLIFLNRKIEKKSYLPFLSNYFDF